MSLILTDNKAGTVEHSLSISEEGNEYVIRLRDHSLPLVAEFQNGIKVGEGFYTNEDLAEALLHAQNLSVFKTPILPRGCISYLESTFKTYCFFEVPSHRRTVFYHDAVIDDVPFPNLIFGYELRSRTDRFEICKVFVGALEKGLTNEESEVYFYPYTNVDRTYEVCLGSSQLPQITRISQLSTVPEVFFNSQNSDCYYGHANGSGLTYRELLEKVKGKEFLDNYLKTTGLTLADWISGLTSLS
ncbi:hypothetical protein C0Q44_27840 [Paenibacillus sp. PCH8]|uniref:hypothetical protein n=1 Tax=Paenibacillus sp. PCH8 TaxID=2066524 RepID=UPI000CF91898|nr:hypothetical protein [Paenibacillus sp. PCH8]PQP80231.1 hypothetical protein C0Q44_27840 [Paenibacillus sp. PCH8]